VGSVALVSLASLVGLLTISLSEHKLRQALFLLVSLAAGALFGDAIIHLLPEVFHEASDAPQASLYVIGGIFLFFVLEKFLRWRHQHTVHHEAVEPVGYMNLLSDGLHNLIDGMLIAVSYLVSLPVGVGTTIAVLLHELPQEIGDFSVLLHAGFSKSRALWFNFISASLAVVGALAVLWAREAMEALTLPMLGVTAGSFIYIAGSDLLPELQKERRPARSALQLLAMGAGVGLMLLLLWME